MLLDHPIDHATLYGEFLSMRWDVCRRRQSCLLDMFQNVCGRCTVCESRGPEADLFPLDHQCYYPVHQWQREPWVRDPAQVVELAKQAMVLDFDLESSHAGGYGIPRG